MVVEGSPLPCFVQCEAMLETPMTYSLFEFARESADDIVTLPDPTAETERVSSTVQTVTTTQSPPPKRKEALSKQAKRRLAGRTSEW